MLCSLLYLLYAISLQYTELSDWNKNIFYDQIDITPLTSSSSLSTSAYFSGVRGAVGVATAGGESSPAAEDAELTSWADADSQKSMSSVCENTFYVCHIFSY